MQVAEAKSNAALEDLNTPSINAETACVDAQAAVYVVPQGANNLLQLPAR